jgi:hypothetical protein
MTLLTHHREMGPFERPQTGHRRCDVPARRAPPGVIEMRKIAGVVTAAAVALAIGSSVPADAAAAKVSCKTMSGSAKLSPPLPKLGTKKTVVPTMTVTGAKVGGCVGGGLQSATAALRVKFAKASNCTMLGTGVGNTATGSLALAWNTHQSSTAAVTVVTVPKKPTTLKLAGTVSSGLFKGSRITVTWIYAPPKGGCTANALSKVTFKQTTPLVIR